MHFSLTTANDVVQPDKTPDLIFLRFAILHLVLKKDFKIKVSPEQRVVFIAEIKLISQEPVSANADLLTEALQSAVYI